jgi:hypothetical protein
MSFWIGDYMTYLYDTHCRCLEAILFRSTRPLLRIASECEDLLIN